MRKIYSLIIFIAMLTQAGCVKEMLTPADDNHSTFQRIYEDPNFADGLIINAYTRLPLNSYSFSEVATDDAVSNDKFNPILQIGTGMWSSQNNPLEQWKNSYTAIMYLNKFLGENSKINWSYTSADAKRLYADLHQGEAYALRALFYHYLLQAHGGYNDAGQLLGVPIITTDFDVNSSFQQQRNTFEECMQQIYSDLAAAEALLPLDYVNLTSISQVPAKYAGVSMEDYNRVFGNFMNQRISGRIVKAIRAKAALLAASPAYSAGTTTTWANVAAYAGEVINLLGFPANIDQNGYVFYKAANIDAINLPNRVDQKEMLWRGAKQGVSNSFELNAFPPSLFGNGRINPTQNLVDAFPMLNGYPITHSSASYNASNPYAGRDPRLAQYIVYNGSVLATKTISINEGSTTGDQVNYIKTSTRTGYYMKKLCREDVNLNPASQVTKVHYVPKIRYTEIFLIYAEAANEAYGPNGRGSFSFSAKDVIGQIRRRAGISQPDNYLASISTTEDMRKLIRNERRLELCFEGFRFWDLRRWKADLTEPAKGVNISADNLTYTYGIVEKRPFSNNMYYGPIPYQEVLKSNLSQNSGW
ncbi:MAG TPA: RagB/SusD family nutrient uptake outer membrane protein [Bacteroidales bacterium]|nr:RagB/SusD family nutrient uptake outer membrane protein [Bacteroidales bacterium]